MLLFSFNHIAHGLVVLPKSSVLHVMPLSPFVCAVMSMSPPPPPIPALPGVIFVLPRLGSVPPLIATPTE
jgi:hypothetical protein